MTEIDNNEFVDFAVEARKYQTQLTTKYKQRKPWQPVNENEIRAHIPGTIVEICVAEGQSLKKGDLLMIHEAMKMQNRIVMPFDGRVAKINVAIGERIPKNHLMVVLE